MHYADFSVPAIDQESAPFPSPFPGVGMHGLHIYSAAWRAAEFGSTRCPGRGHSCPWRARRGPGKFGTPFDCIHRARATESAFPAPADAADELVPAAFDGSSLPLQPAVTSPTAPTNNATTTRQPRSAHRLANAHIHPRIWPVPPMYVVLPGPRFRGGFTLDGSWRGWRDSRRVATMTIDHWNILFVRGSPSNRSNHKLLVRSTAMTTASRGPCSSAPLKWRPLTRVITQPCGRQHEDVPVVFSPC